MTVIAALMTSFYSWRLIFMTFHGKARAPAEVMKHVHELPQVMLMPLYVLAAGALLAGIIFHGAFLSDDAGEFWKGSVLAAEHVIEEMHHAPLWVVWIPTVVMLIGFGIAYWFYIVDPTAPRRLAEQHDWLYRFLLNKWYFDELYDFLFVRSVDLARPLPVEEGRRLGHRRLRARWRLGARPRRDAAGGPAPDRLPLSLCLRHADRRRRAGHLADVRRLRIAR